MSEEDGVYSFAKLKGVNGGLNLKGGMGAGREARKRARVGKVSAEYTSAMSITTPCKDSATPAKKAQAVKR